MNDWIRPYTPGTGRWLVIGWEAFALALLGWRTVELFEVSGTGIPILVGAIAGLWAVGTWRILQMGAYIGASGVHIRGLLRSRTLHWQDIKHVRLHQATHKLGPLKIDSGMTVLIERTNGSAVNTELWAKGVDFHSRPTVFRAVYHELRDRHLAATAI